MLMNTKTILGLSLTTVFVVSMIGYAYASSHPAWLGVDDFAIESNTARTTSLVVDATDTIPNIAGAGVLAGFGWFYDNGPDTVFAVTTHEPVRDSRQNPDHWHTHNVIAGPSNDSGVADACIVSLSGYVQAGIAIQDDIMTVNVPATTLSGDITTGPGAFQIIPTDPVNNVCDETLLADGTPSGLHLGVKFT